MHLPNHQKSRPQWKSGAKQDNLLTYRGIFPQLLSSYPPRWCDYGHSHLGSYIRVDDCDFLHSPRITGECDHPCSRRSDRCPEYTLPIPAYLTPRCCHLCRGSSGRYHKHGPQQYLRHCLLINCRSGLPSCKGPRTLPRSNLDRWTETTTAISTNG